MLLPFLPPLADLPPTECLAPDSASKRMSVAESPVSLPESQQVGAQAREMVQLRRAIRMSPLSGSMLDFRQDGPPVGTGTTCSDEAEFVQVLHRVVESSPVQPTSGVAADPAVSSDQRRANLADTTGFLRKMSRQLDDLANDLEEEQDYETADRLRELSDQLRQRARAVTR
jgi:hypothetical protein